MDPKMIVYNDRASEDCTCVQHRFLDCLRRGQNDEAKSIMKNSENFDQLADTSGHTWLHYSAEYGNAEMTQHLIDEGWNVDAYGNSGLTPLMVAANSSNDLRTVEVLLKNNADIYCTDADGNNSLTLAFYSILHAMEGKIEALRSILKMFFDKLNSDFLRGTLTQYLLSLNDFAQLAVVVFGDAEVTRFMLDNTYSIDYCEPKLDQTALHCAMLFVRFENAKILIERGANLSALDYGDKTPLAHYPGNFEELDENYEVLKTFLRYSTRLSAPGRRGYSVVEELLMSGNKEIVKTILLSGIDVEACFHYKDNTLFSCLITNDNAEVLDLFAELDIKFDVNEQVSTALMSFTRAGCPRKVEFLLRHGADVNMRDRRSGFAALSHAQVYVYDIVEQHKCGKRQSDIARVIELLLLHGADAQTFFSDRPYLLDYSYLLPTKVILAHLAMLGALEKPSLADAPRRAIESTPRLKTYFDLYTQQLEKMKDHTFSGTVTLFKLLTYSEGKIAAYARNEELFAGLDNVVKITLHRYYLNTILRNLSRGRALAKLQVEAAAGIETLTGLCADVYHSIVYRIITFLGHQDLCNLRGIASDLSTMMEQ